MNVLSLFDGISCGYMALKRAGVSEFTYYASEIDPYALEISKKVSPEIIQLGDVRKINASDLPKIDLLIGGSPCQGFSYLNKGGQEGFDHPQSGLFFEYVRLYKELKPTYFLLENVPMLPKWRDRISGELGLNPLKLDSSLVSAQKRPRLYWTNISIPIPQDRQIHQNSVLEKPAQSLMKSKSPILTTRPTGTYTPLECERLQTLPDNITEGIPIRERYKLIGNAWTVDLIAIFFEAIKCLS